MTEENDKRQRILVALDGSRESLAALEAAVSLAEELDADLIGLFVEDVNLLRLAQMPFAREIHMTTARLRALTGEDMSQAMRLQAARARRALQEAAKRAQVESEFQIMRGLVPASVVAAAVDADLLILGRFSRSVSRRRLGSTAKAALAQARRTILLTRQRLAIDRSVLVTFDDTDLSWRALRKAAALSHPNYPLMVLLLTPTLAEAEKWRAEVSVWLEERNQQANFRQLTEATMPRLLHVVQAENCDLLIMGSERLPVAAETAVSLLNQLDCSLMLVR